MEILKVLKERRLASRKGKDKFMTKVLTVIIGDVESSLKTSNPTSILKVLEKAKKSLETNLTHRYTEEDHTELCVISGLLDEFKPALVEGEELENLIKSILSKPDAPKYFPDVMVTLKGTPNVNMKEAVKVVKEQLEGLGK